MICKYCGKEISKGEVWNPDGNGNGYHHKCLIDMEFDENETYIENLKNRSIIIPNGATNGDMLLTMFDTATVYGIDKENDCITICIDNNFYQKFRYSWWNAPYKKEVEE